MADVLPMKLPTTAHGPPTLAIKKERDPRMSPARMALNATGPRMSLPPPFLMLLS